MRNVYRVAAREYRENVQTKAFWLGILILPVILAASIALPTLFERTKDARRYAVVDESGWLAAEVDARVNVGDVARLLQAIPEAASAEDIPSELQPIAPLMAEADESRARELAEALLGEDGATHGVDDATREAFQAWWRGLSAKDADAFDAGLSRADRALTEIVGPGAVDYEALTSEVASGRLFAYFVIGPDPVAGSDGFRYISKNLTDDGLLRWYGRAATEIVRERRIAESGIAADTVRHLTSGMWFEKHKVTAEGGESRAETKDTVRQFAPMAFVYLLWISVFMASQMRLTGTIAEKSSRTVEVLLSCVSPLELMAGKIAGIAASGLTIIGCWAIVVGVSVTTVPAMVEQVAQLGLAEIVTDPRYVVSFAVYFLLGYLLYASLYVAIGSACSDLKEAQAVAGPMILVLMLPILVMVPVGNDPNGTLARVLSFIPTFTPFVMMNRAAGPPAVWEYVATSALLVVSVAGALWAAAKVFRVGVLLTGKPPSLWEIA
ncbi:ABC transporter permease, partial [Candidatus Poribacteria bacterium]|nr:ABC transporter permease [Candidatus Poribacteria bacterium]